MDILNAKKSEVLLLVKFFCMIVNMQFGAKVKIIKSDNGSECTLGPMKNFYGEHGIVH